ncbi:MAG: fumarate hydratase [Candidatus Methylopumilus sp.]|nr:fumarate hydratase [Candidatus Methylopumilus sp.]
MKTSIKKEDFIESISDALQFISYYHSEDFILSMREAYEKETSIPAKDAMLQILTSSKMSALGHRPICQDTGIVIAFVEVGMNVEWDSDLSIEDMVNEGVKRAYSNQDNPLRPSMVSDPAGKRQNTKDNTPAITHVKLIKGNKVSISISAKGGGSENKAQFITLNPSDSIVDWVLKVIPEMGAGWCPPGVIGIGIGGSSEKAMLMAKESLMLPIDIHSLVKRGAKNKTEELRIELYNKINQLGIGAQGFGGLTTVLDVKIIDYPCHASSLPVALIPNCAATRHTHFTLDGSGPAHFKIPDLSLWPKDTWAAQKEAKRINLDSIDKKSIEEWKEGDLLLLSGKLLTARDGAHKKIADLFKKGEALPVGVNLKNKFIYYVGPVDAVRNEVIGPAGPTTASRMDQFMEMMLAELGIMGTIGKAERGESAVQTIKKYQSVYLSAVGGAAYLVSKAITSSKVVAFPELGMEAIYEFEVKDMPVMVSIDTQGKSIYPEAPSRWKNKSIPINSLK